MKPSRKPRTHFKTSSGSSLRDKAAAALLVAIALGSLMGCQAKEEAKQPQSGPTACGPDYQPLSLEPSLVGATRLQFADLRTSMQLHFQGAEMLVRTVEGSRSGVYHLTAEKKTEAGSIVFTPGYTCIGSNGGKPSDFELSMRAPTDYEVLFAGAWRTSARRFSVHVKDENLTYAIQRDLTVPTSTDADAFVASEGWSESRLYRIDDSNYELRLDASSTVNGVRIERRMVIKMSTSV